jgi:molybdopterin-containing oxidoreductase family membrane subunit
MISATTNLIKNSFKSANGPPGNLRLIQGSSALLVLALATAFYLLATQGHAAFNTNDYGVTWGLPIACYVYFVLTSTGLTFIASLALLFGFDQFYPVAKRCVWLAFATLIAGFSVLALELGHPFRMLWAMPTGLQYLSPMFWMGIFYLIYMVLLLAKFWRLQRGDWDSPLSNALAVAQFVSVVIAHGTLGLLFGMMAMRPMWFGGMIPIYFLLTAALSGAAFTVFFTYLAYDFDVDKLPKSLRLLALKSALPNVFATMIGITILAVAFRTITGLWSNLDGLQVYDVLVRTPLFHLEFWIGLVLPFLLMLPPQWQRRPRVQITAAVLVMASLFLGRLEFLVSGQMVPMFKGTWVPEIIEYSPSFAEWTLAVIGFALVFFLYALGERLFDLSAEPPHTAHLIGAVEAQERSVQ